MEKARLAELVTLVRGVSYKKEQASKNEKEGYTSILRANNINDGAFNFDELVFVPSDLVTSQQKISKNDIVITMSSGSKAHVGKVAIAKTDMDSAFGAFCAKIIPQKIAPKYLFYILRSSDFRHHIETSCKGTNINNIKQEYILNYELLVPSIPEQERIVSRIEELFSELDNGVETLKKTKQQLAVYRQAVLKEAFCLEEQTVKVSSICTVVRGGSPRPAGDEKYYNGTIPFLKVADLTNSDDMYLSTHTYTIKEAGLKKTRMVPPNTLLLSNSGATLGVPKICTFETTFNDGIAAFLNLEEGREYLPFHYYFWLSKLPEMRAIDQGAAQPNLNTAIIGDVDIPHCNFETQRQVAEWIESRMSVCDNIEKTVDTALQQAEAMQQSILKKAFEGAL